MEMTMKRIIALTLAAGTLLTTGTIASTVVSTDARASDDRAKCGSYCKQTKKRRPPWPSDNLKSTDKLSPTEPGSKRAKWLGNG